MSKVLFANRDVTVHLKDGELETLPDGSTYQPQKSLVLKAGTTIAPNEVTPLLLSLVEKGESPGLSLLTELQAKKRIRDARLAKGDLSALEENEESLPEDKE